MGAGAWACMCRPSVWRAARLGCAWCVCCLCGVCVLVGAGRCGVWRGAVVRGAASLRSSPWCPPLLRYLVVLCLLWLVALPPSPPASLPRLLRTLLFPYRLRRSLPFPLLSVALPSSLVRFFLASSASLCVSRYFSCLLPRSLGPLLPLFIDPVRQRKGRVWAVAGVAASMMTCSLRCRCWVSTLLRRRCLLTWSLCVSLCRVSSPYHLYGVGTLCVGIGCLVTSRPCMLPLPCLHLLVGFITCLRASGILLARLVCACFLLQWQALIPSIPLSAVFVTSLSVVSPSRLGLGVICCALVPCRVRGGGVGCGSFVFADASGRFVAYSFPALLSLVPSLASCALLACSPSCGSSVGGGLGRSCFPYLVACGPLRAFVHVLSSPASFSLLAPSYPFASSRRLLRVCIRLHCISCFACGGLYVLLQYGHTFRSLCMRGWACFLVSTYSVTILLSAALAASLCVSFTPPRSRCDLLWACAL